MMNTSSLTYTKKVGIQKRIDTPHENGKLIPVSEVPRYNKQQIISNHHGNLFVLDEHSYVMKKYNLS